MGGEAEGELQAVVQGVHGAIVAPHKQAGLRRGAARRVGGNVMALNLLLLEKVEPLEHEAHGCRITGAVSKRVVFSTDTGHASQQALLKNAVTASTSPWLLSAQVFCGFRRS